VLQQTVFYGLPMYAVGDEPPPAGAAAADAATADAPATIIDPVTGQTVAPVNLQPQYTQHTAPDGTTFASINGDVQTANGYPIVPRTTVDVTQPAGAGLVAHGVLLTGLTAEEADVPNPAFARAGVGQASQEPSKLPADFAWPSQLATVNLLADEQTLVVTPEQLVSDGEGGARRRRFTSLASLVYYAPASADDVVAPRILAADASSSESGTGFSIETTDDEGVARVVVLYRVDNEYRSVDLSRVGETNRWEGGVTGVTDPRFIVQSVDVNGNIGTSSNKAVLYLENGEGPDFTIGLEGTLGENSWYRDTPIATLIGDVDPGDVLVSVDGGAAVPFDEFEGLPPEDGVYELSASSGETVVTLTVRVDTTAPVADVSPPLQNNYPLNAAVTVTVTCTDPNAPESSGVASCTPQTVTLDTATPGAKTFTVTTRDLAGNTREQVFSYNVQSPYTYDSLLVRTDRVNVIRAGWWLPVIFRAFGPTGQQITTTSGFTRTVSPPQACPATLPDAPLPPGNMLQPTENIFFFDPFFLRAHWWIWQSPSPIPQPEQPCYRLTAKAPGDTGPGISWWVKLVP
jgi:hypothetical protein